MSESKVAGLECPESIDPLTELLRRKPPSVPAPLCYLTGGIQSRGVSPSSKRLTSNVLEI